VIVSLKHYLLFGTKIKNTQNSQFPSPKYPCLNGHGIMKEFSGRVSE